MQNTIFPCAFVLITGFGELKSTLAMEDWVFKLTFVEAKVFYGVEACSFYPVLYNLSLILNVLSTIWLASHFSFTVKFSINYFALQSSLAWSNPGVQNFNISLNFVINPRCLERVSICKNQCPSPVSFALFKVAIETGMILESYQSFPVPLSELSFPFVFCPIRITYFPSSMSRGFLNRSLVNWAIWVRNFEVLSIYPWIRRFFGD